MEFLSSMGHRKEALIMSGVINNSPADISRQGSRLTLSPERLRYPGASLRVNSPFGES